MASVTDVRERAERLGLGVSVTRPGDGATRYSFYRKVEGRPHVEGRTLGWAKGSKAALNWLDGFDEGRESTGYLGELARLKVAVREVLVDLELHVSTHGPGPDRRLAELKAALGGE